MSDQVVDSPLLPLHTKLSQQLKIPIRINQTKFPLDFFSHRISRSNSRSSKLQSNFDYNHKTPITSSPKIQNPNETPNFRSQKQIIISKAFQQEDNPSINKQQYKNLLVNKIRETNTSTNNRIQNQYSSNIRRKKQQLIYRTSTANNPHVVRGYQGNEDRHMDQKLFRFLNDIVEMTSSIKKVYRKHSIELVKQNLGQVRGLSKKISLSNKRSGIHMNGNLVSLPPLNTKGVQLGLNLVSQR